MYIERAKVLEEIDDRMGTLGFASPYQDDITLMLEGMARVRDSVEDAPTADVVEVETLKSWLYEIAMNNTQNSLSDACEEIISRLDGLRVFARERR